MAVVRVVLVGDSIRMNATPFVREHLPADWVLHSPPVNGESSHKLRAEIADWAPPGSADLVHINCGLHDIRHDPGRDGPVTTPEDYAANLDAIFGYLAGTGACVIWATSTPIDEATHNVVKCSRRYVADLLRYNAISIAVAKRHGIRLHDLHAALMAAPWADLLSADGVHFKAEGNAWVGRLMAEALIAARATG